MLSLIALKRRPPPTRKNNYDSIILFFFKKLIEEIIVILWRIAVVDKILAMLQVCFPNRYVGVKGAIDGAFRRK